MDDLVVGFRPWSICGCRIPAIGRAAVTLTAGRLSAGLAVAVALALVGTAREGTKAQEKQARVRSDRDRPCVRGGTASRRDSWGLAQVNKTVGSDFNRGPEAFTNASDIPIGARTQVDSARPNWDIGGETNNASGDAIASDRTRGGTPQDV